jgi:molybdopterin-guanine dinucleotide biosynthesis protein A
MNHSSKNQPDNALPVCVVLAGGLARRMGGGAKGLLPLGGKPILDHMIARLKPQCARIVLNVNGPTEEFERFGLPIIADTIPDHAGPLAGILAALDWMAETHPMSTTLLSVATDTPFVPDDLVAKLETARSEAGTALACACSNGRIHPPFSLWPVRVRDALRTALLQDKARKMETVMTRLGYSVARWDTQPIDPFFNINTPEDLLTAEAMQSPPRLLLDLKGLKCPLPALRTAKALARIEDGAELEIICTDPMAQIDIPHLVQTEGHKLVSQRLEAESCIFVIRKGQDTVSR